MAHPQSNRPQKDLRRTPRRRLHYPARIDCGDGSALRDCHIWDISETGAKLTIGAQDDIPQEFTLVLAMRSGMIRRCRVVHRSEQHIGVEFQKVSTTSLSPDRKLEQLNC